MPTEIKIPERTERRCEPCTFHKLIGAFHVRTGQGSYREYSCMHQDAFRDLLPEQYGSEHLKAKSIILNQVTNREKERYIGNTEKQPDWCPLKKEEA